VTATLPPFGQPGARLDVTVAAIGDSSNLQGGLLVMTPLKGPDNQVYAVAQGSVVTGGFVAGGRGSSQTVNTLRPAAFPMEPSSSGWPRRWSLPSAFVSSCGARTTSPRRASPGR